MGRYWKEYLELYDTSTLDEEPMKLDPFGRVASNYISEQDAFINLAVGSIRSGKTVAAIVAFLRFIHDSVHTYFAMAGKTLKALERNVVRPMKGIMRYLGIQYYHHKKDGEIDLFNMGDCKKTIVLYSIEKKGSDEVIKGSTYGGALLDEVTVMDMEGLDMMISRNSLKGARIFMTCNPANPNNKINQEYVLDEELQKMGYVKVTNFLLEDNLSLTPEYIQRVKKIYPEDSVFYKRNILGLWASGQGLIYTGFTDKNIYHEDKPLDYYDYLEIGSDYGSSSTTCWILGGIKEFEDHNEYDLIAEGGYNAKREGMGVTDYEITEMIYDMQEEYHLTAENIFYPSHDASSLEIELRKNKKIELSVEKFTPDVLKSIEQINSLFHVGYLHVHSRCSELINCIHGYEWDPRAARNGEDKPLKVDDHYCDAMRAPIMNHLWEDNAVGFLLGLG